MKQKHLDNLSIANVKLTRAYLFFCQLFLVRHNNRAGNRGVHAIDADHVSLLAAHTQRLVVTKEMEMRAQFDEAYVSYVQRTPHFFPRMGVE
jgi:protein-S-isoprenylcysteine O-methyltransferase Ste14